MTPAFPVVVRIERDETLRREPVDGPVPIAEPSDELEEARRRRKDQKRAEDATRPLESWERYRALNDAIDEGYELIDIANREARFALIIMGALNAALFVIGSRLHLAGTLPKGAEHWIILALVVYAIVALYFFIAAIDTLRPRGFQPDLPLGIRYYETASLRSAASHLDAWKTVNIGELNAELAVLAHALCLKNRAKQAALRRVYAGLRIMPLLIAVSLVMLGLFAVIASSSAVAL